MSDLVPFSERVEVQVRPISRTESRLDGPPTQPPPRGELSPWRGATKRAFDVIGSAVLLVVLSPLFLLLAAVVKASSPGPVFYGSPRLARAGGQFKMWKYRSMVTNGDEVIEAHFQQFPRARDSYERDLKLVEDPRVTRTGRWLRTTSLDELPQLWNVLIGHMSLVGPRPKLLEEADRYGPVIDYVLSVRPGLTGIWQAGGRSEVSYDERIANDIDYVAENGFVVDVVLCLRTALLLVRPGGSKAC